MSLPQILLRSISSREDFPFYSPSSADRDLLSLMINYLAAGGAPHLEEGINETFLQTAFPLEFNRIAIFIYHPGHKRLGVVRSAKQIQEKFSVLLRAVTQHARFPQYCELGFENCRIQLDFIIDLPLDCEFDKLSSNHLGGDRFEFGVDGLRIVHDGHVSYLFPGDAFVHSILGMGQLKRYLQRLVGVEDLFKCRLQKFNSISYVNWEKGWKRLYRGYPLMGELTEQSVQHAVKLGIKHILNYQRDNGQFLYYYDAAKDSLRDHEHRHRDPTKNPYYNILRHSGGSLLLLSYLKYSGDTEVIPHIDRSIEYLLEQLIIYPIDEQTTGGYIYYNRKAKLGGSGLALYLLAEYQRLTGNPKYKERAALIKNHLIAQITATGEFLYYSIYLDNRLTAETNHKYFSFYYPGEAMIGLVTYYKHLAEAHEKAGLQEAIKTSLRFLLVDRKEVHKDQYTTLPSDSWLMMAINELWDAPELRDELYAQSVFTDGDTMTDLMYDVDNAPYFDYIGSFFYRYGDHPFPDGARCEGLLGAFELAIKYGDRAREAVYGRALLMAIWATLKLVNVGESLYAAPNPLKALGGIRFKFTRQWFRIDTIQHVAAFYLKALPYWSRLEALEPEQTRNSLSLSMIVRNEEMHLPRALEHVKIFADEIIVLDTGSVDRTKDIAKELGAKVYDFEWCDDFAKARNVSLSYCTKKYVMWLDADDVITEEVAKKIRLIMDENINWDVLYLPYCCNSSSGKNVSGLRKKPPRIWRNHIGIEWIYPIHEILLYPRRVRKEKGVDDIEIFHAPLTDTKSKADRNLRILLDVADKPEHRESDYFFWHIAKEYSGLGDQNRAISYFQKALENVDPRASVTKSRQYLGLGRQYKRMKRYKEAIEAFGKAALAYENWREPYVAIAECLWKLGEDRAAARWIEVAANVMRPQGHLERAELYTGSLFRKYQKSSADILELTDAVATDNVVQKTPCDQERVGTLVAGGDVMLGRQMPGYIGIHGIDWPFGGVISIMGRGDVVLVNLECVVANRGTLYHKGGRRPFHYIGRPEHLNVLVNAGVNVVTLGNNHSCDYGPEALQEELQLLSACGIAASGAGKNVEDAARPAYIRVDDVVVAVISLDTEAPELAAGKTTFGVFFARESDELLRRLAAPLAEAKLYADIVVVSPHWGRNWAENAPVERVRLAHTIIDLGAHAILGHSSHILHGIEIYRGRPIVYDMGSLLFDRVRQNRIALSALFSLDFNRSGFTELRIDPVILEPGHSKLAKCDEAARIRSLVTRLNAELGAIEDVRQDGEALVIKLDAWDMGQRRSKDPVTYSTARGLKRLPSRFERESSATVTDHYPPWSSIRWGQTLEVLGFDVPAVVRQGYGFVHQVLLRANGPLQGRWEAKLWGVHCDTGVVFEWVHPVADGAWPVANWKPGQLIIDRTLVRPPVDLKPGVYELRWELFDRDSQERQSLPSPATGVEDTGIRVGSIEVTDSAPRGVAGLAWT